MSDETLVNPLDLAAELTIAWLGNPNNRADINDIPAFFRAMHETIADLSSSGARPPEKDEVPVEAYAPAVSVRKSLASRDHIISMIDGKPYRALRRHLSTHGLTPEEYRERYNLRPDYPMVAESYSEQRREMAKKIGLGNKGRSARKRQA